LAQKYISIRISVELMAVATASVGAGGGGAYVVAETHESAQTSSTLL
jgi:hypothetical protein